MENLLFLGVPILKYIRVLHYRSYLICFTTEHFQLDLQSLICPDSINIPEGFTFAAISESYNYHVMCMHEPLTIQL